CIELICGLPSSTAFSAAAVTASCERVVNWNSTGLLSWVLRVAVRSATTSDQSNVNQVESIPLNPGSARDLRRWASPTHPAGPGPGCPQGAVERSARL